MMMMMMMMRLGILALSLCAFLQITASQEVLVVGADLGWTIPPGGAIAYDTWAMMQTFDVGDVLLFNFTNGEQDVARVTKEAFLKCNTTNTISVNKTSPANFTLDGAGDYYFTSTLDGHCIMGQKLAVHVSGSGPSPSHSVWPWPWPRPWPKPRGPLNYTVGGALGWIVPPGGEIFYASWAYKKTFIIGDALVFLFINGTQDVAVVSKEAYENCETNNTIAVYSSSPIRIVLNATGEHYYTSTYKDHCALGQKLAINVTSNTSSSSSGSGYGPALSPKAAFGPSAFGPSASISSASRVVSGCIATFFFVLAMSLFY